MTTNKGACPNEIEKLAGLVSGRVQIAGIYFEDGLPATAASKLREAAAICDRIADLRARAHAQGTQPS